MFWIEDLWTAFEAAHREPIDRDLIQRVYEFAWWAVIQDDGGRTASSTLTGFFEELPTNPQVRKFLPEFMTRGEFMGMVDIFRYLVSPEEHQQFVNDFLTRRQKIERAERNNRHRRSDATPHHSRPHA